MTDALFQIQPRLQELVEVFSAALNIEIEIFDTLCRVAGTGDASHLIGDPIPPCWTVAQYICGQEVGKSVFAHNIPVSLCAECTRSCTSKNSHQRNGVYRIIEYGNYVIGIIGIFANNEERTELFVQEPSTMLGIAEQLTHIIMNFTWEHYAREKLQFASRVVNAVLHMCDKGIMLLDHKNCIVDINAYLLERLKASRENLVGQDATQVFPGFDPRLGNASGAEQQVRHTVGNRQLYLLCSLKPLFGKEDDGWLICFMEDCQSEERLTRAAGTRRKAVRLSDIVSSHEGFNAFKEKVRTIAANDSTVLLVGETGTGKELFARALHAESPRRAQGFVAINCGSIPENLLESELFGYEKGAFTGASSTGKHGKFYLADKGTLFLDELEVLPLYLQPKLLRAIEQREIERIGSGQPIPVDVRIVAATNLRLEDMVRRGEFREDLYYRLNVVSLPIPPLRERGNDVLVLAQHFVKILSGKFFKDIKGLSREAMNLFKTYRWPGNVREVQNAIEYAINMESSQFITVESLPAHIRNQGESLVPLRTDERERIVNALERFGWTEEGKLLAARALGISRSTIYRKIRMYGLRMAEGR